jgi:TRAP-type C4-dicarboxylate transport system substrate-binding protein
MKLRKKFGILLICFLVMLVAACGGSSSGSGGGGGSSSSGSGGGGSSGGSGKTFTLSYTSTFPVATWDYEAAYYMMEEFTRQVEERTNGRVKFSKTYSNALVPQNELLDALQAGVVDFALASPGFYGDVVLSAGFSTLPFWSPTDEFGMYILKESEIGRLIEEEYENYGVKVMGYGPTGEYGFVSNKPVRKFEDFKGMLIRSGGGLWNAWYDAMGAAPAGVTVVESYEALQRGTINATGTPYHNVETFKYYEVAPYMIRPPVYSSTFMITYVSLDTWNSLPKDVQDVMTEIFAEMERLTMEGAKIFNENNDKMAANHGVEVIVLPDEEVEKWKESGQAAWEMFANMNDRNRRIIEILREETAKWSK